METINMKSNELQIQRKNNGTGQVCNIAIFFQIHIASNDHRQKRQRSKLKKLQHQARVLQDTLSITRTLKPHTCILIWAEI